MSVLAVKDWTEFPSVAQSFEEPQRGFLVVLEPSETGWGAYVPDLPGVAAAAKSEGEIRQLISDAVEFHIEGLRAEGEPVPIPTTRALWVVAGS